MDKLDIATKNNTTSELTVKNLIEDLLRKWDMSPYFFTKDVIIEDRAMPHSHPVLTINSFPYNDQLMHLTDLLHEHLHWYFEEKKSQVNEAVTDLKMRYVEVPVGHPLGCRDETSTYEHLLLCRLCHNLSSSIFGAEIADRVLYYLQNHHYLWVYAKVESDSEYLDGLLAKHGLTLDTN